MRVLRRIRPCSSGCWGRWTGQAVSTERLCALLWDDNPPDQARRAVQAHVSRIRGPLGDVLLPKGDGYLLRVPAEAVGASRFRALVDQARAADDLTERDRLLGAALAFWRGTALKDAAGERLRQRLCGELEELRLHATEESLATPAGVGPACRADSGNRPVERRASDPGTRLRPGWDGFGALSTRQHRQVPGRAALRQPARLRSRWGGGRRGTARQPYSHSIVPGGLLVTSRTTRLTSGTSLVMRVEMRAITS